MPLVPASLSWPAGLVAALRRAKQKVRKDVPMGSGYRIEWGGQFENYERASKRLALVIPAVMAIIIGMLFWMFKSARPALAVFSVVPLAASGGMLGLLLRGLPFSLPAAVGFIALGGVSVLNGVVISSTAKARMAEGESADRAVAHGAIHSVRAVLTTAAVAALGFLPMALWTSAGSEVQRPLATVVIVGIVFGTVLTLAVFPGVLATALKGWKMNEAVDDADDDLADPASGIAE